jgi:hypothetical protein
LQSTAGAQAELEVAHTAGAASCPDAAALQRRTEQIRGTSSLPPEESYHVTFGAEPSGFTASIERRGAVGTRVLRAPGATCGALAEAVAVTLALLLDGEQSVAEPLDPSGAAARREPALALGAARTAATAPPATPATPITAAPRAQTAREPHATFALGAAAGFGLLRVASPALLADVGWLAGRFRVGAGALGFLPSTVALGPGRVRTTLASGTLRGCAAALELRTLRLELCSGAHVGAQRGRAGGYTRNEGRRHLWVALPLELALARFVGALGFECAAGALLPLRRHDFSVENVGSSYRSWPVAAVLSMRVVAVWPRLAGPHPMAGR